MHSFSTRSEARLRTCDPNLIKLFQAVVMNFDCSVICGFRGEEAQMAAFDAGHSKARFGESPHNFSPSFAVDVAPYPIDWNDRDRFHYFAGYVLGFADMLEIPIRWGGDWDDDREVADNGFDDLVHFELADWRVRSQLSGDTL